MAAAHVAHLLIDGPDLVPVLQVVVLAGPLGHYEFSQSFYLHIVTSASQGCSTLRTLGLHPTYSRPTP